MITHVPILMYHSISHAGGPTSIPPEVFAAQMRVIEDLNWDVVSLSCFCEWHCGQRELERPSLVITFDDGFKDFETNAFPILKAHGFPSTVFLPSRRLGATENWIGANQPPRALMDWATVIALSTQGVDFAPHSRTHANLSQLQGASLFDEIIGAKDDLRAILPNSPSHFAPPYGAISVEALKVIGETYDLSVGVEFDLATRKSLLFNLPRVEMLYYMNPMRFASLLRGEGRFYLEARKMLRLVRRAFVKTPRSPY